MISESLAGAMFGLSAGISPGPLLTVVITETLRSGIRGGIRVALAPLLTDCPIIFLSLGASNLLRSNPQILVVISLLGSAYLVYLAGSTWRAQEASTDSIPEASGSLRRGILTNLLNPHPYLFWLTVGAPFLVRSWEEGVLGAAGFISGFYLFIVGTKVGVAYLVSRSGKILEGPGYRWTLRLLSGALLFFALFLFLEGVRLAGQGQL